MMKKLFLYALALVLLSCSGAGKPSKNNLVIAIEKAPMTLDPRYALDTFSERICRLMYDGLLEIDDNFNFFPNLAESYSMPDDRTYLFKLRKGVRFHDDTPFTSRDVKYTYESIMDAKYASAFANAFQEVESIEAPDDHTVAIKLKKPFGPFKTALRIGIIPEHIGSRLGREFTKEPTGTGVFKLKKNMGRDGVVLEKHYGYHGGEAKLRFVTFKPILDDTVRTLEVLKGSVDLVLNAIPAELIPEVEKDGNVEVFTGQGVQYQYMGFNMEDPVLKNLKVRKAIAHAIDRDSIIKYKVGGHAIKSTGLLAPINWAYAKSLSYEYDPKLSQRLLDEAGYPLKKTKKGKFRFPLTYKTSTNPEAFEIAGVVAENLKKIGIDVTLRSLEFGVFFDDIKKGNFQLFTLTWTGITDPDHYYYIFNSKSVPPDGANRGRYRSKRMDHLTEMSRTTTDIAAQKRVYAEIQKLASQDLPYVSFWHKDNIVALRKKVKGFRVKANGEYYYLRNTYKE